MLIVPDHDPTYRIFSIDPGTNTLGVAVIDVDLQQGTAIVVEAFTVQGDRLYQQYPEVIEVHGERVAKLIAHEENLKRLLYQFQPHCVVSEAPFMGRFPQAYAALVECIGAIRRAVMAYNSAMALDMIEPSVVKKAVGASGRGSNKEDVARAIQSLPDLSYCPWIDPQQFDEHTSDAVAVGYCQFQAMKGVTGV